MLVSFEFEITLTKLLDQARKAETKLCFILTFFYSLSFSYELLQDFTSTGMKKIFKS